MKRKLATNIPIILLLLITLLFAKLQINKRTGSKTDICFNICGDARGYYAWLPAIFIYHDLNFHFFDDLESKEVTCGAQVGIPIQDYRYTFEGKTIDKYYPGVSFMMLPFFAIAHIATKAFSDYPPNGYSPLYFKIMALSGVFYYFLGMLLFLKILKKLGLNNWQRSLTLVLMTFGTNAMYYAIDAPLYSHIYSFTLIAGFLYAALCLRDQVNTKNFVWLAFLTGFIFTARPVNLTILLMLPFLLWGRLSLVLNYYLGDPVRLELPPRYSFSLSFFRNPRIFSRQVPVDYTITKPFRLALLLPAFIMPAILMVLYKIETGHLFIYSYGSESFDFLHPHLLGFLFSYNNGVFPYMPLLLMPVLFLFAWYKKENKLVIVGLIVTLAVTIYVHSSWWAWTYGFCFGARTMLDFVPVFGILAGLSLKEAGKKHLYYIIPVYLLCAVTTTILYDQKNHGHLNKYPITDYREAIRNGLGIKP